MYVDRSSDEASGHKWLFVSDFGYWRCSYCHWTGDDYTSPSDTPCVFHGEYWVIKSLEPPYSEKLRQGDLAECVAFLAGYEPEDNYPVTLQPYQKQAEFKG